MQAHIRYTADTGEALVNETFGPNNIRRRTTGSADVPELRLGARLAGARGRGSQPAASF